jgi:uncharacterized membrane protein YgdD (TMEM256/DUF423 family)
VNRPGAEPWVGVAGVLGALGVVAGAFGAHGLRARVAPSALESWETAVTFHLLHAVALLALGLAPLAHKRWPAGLFCAGIVLFCGSIYGLVLEGPSWLGPVTPLGGVAFIAGWLSLLRLSRS